jgi:hypothetical protein
MTRPEPGLHPKVPGVRSQDSQPVVLQIASYGNRDGAMPNTNFVLTTAVAAAG